MLCRQQRVTQAAACGARQQYHHPAYEASCNIYYVRSQITTVLSIGISVYLHEVVRRGERLVQISAEGGAIGDEVVATMRRGNVAMGGACLELCVSLLDPNLNGDLFESAAVGFLTTLGTGPIKGILMKAYHFVPNLSGFRSGAHEVT
jgi:hypothetical protein